MGRVNITRRARLAAYLRAWRTVCLQPGSTDCAMFAAGWVQEITGADPAIEFRGTYASFEEGLKALHQSGFAQIEDLLDVRFGARIGWVHATDGDIVLFPGRAGAPFAFGIASGSHVHVIGLSGGLDVVPVSLAVEVWRP